MVAENWPSIVGERIVQCRIVNDFINNSDFIVSNSSRGIIAPVDKNIITVSYKCRGITIAGSMIELFSFDRNLGGRFDDLLVDLRGSATGNIANRITVRIEKLKMKIGFEIRTSIVSGDINNAATIVFGDSASVGIGNGVGSGGNEFIVNRRAICLSKEPSRARDAKSADINT